MELVPILSNLLGGFIYTVGFFEARLKRSFGIYQVWGMGPNVPEWRNGSATDL